MRPTLSPSRIAVKDVLFATDFSPASEVALDYAAAMARRHGATLHLVHVMPEAELMPTTQGYIPGPSAYLEDMRRETEERLHAQGQSPQLKDLNRRIVVEQGPPARVLKHIIEDSKIDLVVLGTHGRTGVRRLVLGSVAQQILHSAACPVLTIGPEVPADAAGKAIRTVACAVDLLPGSARTYSYGCALAAEYGAELVLLTVDEGDAQRFEYEAAMATVKGEMRLAEFLKAQQPACELQPRLAVGFGPPPEAILKLAEEHKADMLVMGARPSKGLAGVGERILGGTAHHVLAHARVPVLTVRG